MKKIMFACLSVFVSVSLLSMQASAAGRAYVLTSRTTSGDSSRWETDAVISATNREFTDPLNAYAVENGFEIVCYERVSSQQIDDAPVYYQFAAPDNKNHYIVTLSYNVNITFQEGNQSGVTTYMPTTTDDAPYVYSYSVTQKMSTYTTLTATFAVYEYRSSDEYNTQMMILDYNVPMDDGYVEAFPSASYYFYFPIYAPQIVEDMESAITIVEGVKQAIEQQTDEMQDYLEGESRDIDYNTDAANNAEATVDGMMDSAIDNVGTLFSQMDFDVAALNSVVKYFQYPFNMFSGAVTTVAVIYFVQRVLL